jgi:uncharacterized surface protein with fasciclin (FAS1) repeats
MMLLRSIVVVCTVVVANAFQTVVHQKWGGVSRISVAGHPSGAITRLHAETPGAELETYLKEQYPSFMAVLSPNEKAMKALMESESGFTIFCPNKEAFESLGEKKREQLEDIRNVETTDNIGSYHIICEPVTATDLFASGGVITLGGTVIVERSVSGGFFGVGGKEDGGVTIGGSKVVKSIEFGSNGILHETDGLVSPELLWRYMDQLRIPGSK